MHRWIPWVMIGCSIVHIGLGLLDPPWPGVLADGVINSVQSIDRVASLWFMVAGLAFLSLGLVTRRMVRLTGRVPAEAGWGLIAIGLVIVLLRPLDGGWIPLVVGVLTLIAAARTGESAKTRSVITTP
ncbi:DUF6463 family protein [Microlunatus parietis]|uniref:Uncharacterized protein n=1 Tax=Microlunatus parietis TaxID=682979 RepID=A0A7Y9IET4_9ACTN|nr:DUF6463 family protein [Microlunatus parietis]NYE75552.1 hypothetical protein [Microlunatus parietis]